MTIYLNIESLIASRDLSYIVEGAVNIADRKVKSDAKRFWLQAAIREK